MLDKNTMDCFVCYSFSLPFKYGNEEEEKKKKKTWEKKCRDSVQRFCDCSLIGQWFIINVQMTMLRQTHDYLLHFVLFQHFVVFRAF
jgi:hypothetical protein